MTRRLIPFVTLLIAGLTLSLPQLTAQAQTADGVIAREKYTLESGNVYNGNLVVLAGEVTLQHGSTVNGDVSLLSQGRVELNGVINGNVMIIAAEVNLGDSLEVRGNLSVCSANIKRSDGASISGSVSTGCNFTAAMNIQKGSTGNWGNSWFARTFANPFLHLLQIIGTTLAVAALAGLAAVLMPRRLRRARDAAMSAPVTAGIAGFLTVGIAIGLTLVYALSLVFVITLILLPVVGLVWLALMLMIFGGWVVVSEPVGRIILNRLNISTVPMVASVVGAFALTLSIQLFSLIPCMSIVSTVLAVAFGSVGLGALFLTRGGRRSYPTLTVRRIEMV